MYLFTLIISTFFTLSPINGSPNYSFFTTEAKSGDGVISLLKRYDLHEYNCNFDEFYAMNAMSKSEALLAGKSYKLPVYIYNYNGKSIRTTIGIKDWDKAVRIKKYNDFLTESGLRKKSYSDSKILWVPHHEMKCSTEVDKVITEAKNTSSKSNSKNFTYSLFGEHEDVVVVDHTLKNRVFYIVSGHGGPDPGAQCVDCKDILCEDEYAYDVSLRLARNLMQHGATVEIIVQDKNDGIRDDQILKCDGDERHSDGTKLSINQSTRLAQRARLINSKYKAYKSKGYKDQTAIMIHVDSQNQSKRQDVYFYYCKKSTSSRMLAERLQTTFKEKYKKYQKKRGYKGFVKDRGLYMLNYTMPTATYIELANIRNKDDHQRLLLSSNRQALANWIFEGLIK